MATMTLDKIEQKAIANQAAAEAEAKKRWLALAADHLDGKKLDEAEVLETAEVLGLTPGDLRTEAERIRKRRQLVADIARRPAAVAGIAAIDDEWRSGELAVEAAAQALKESRERLQSERDRHEALVRRGDAAVQALRDSADPELIRRAEALQAEQVELRRWIRWDESKTGVPSTGITIRDGRQYGSNTSLAILRLRLEKQEAEVRRSMSPRATDEQVSAAIARVTEPLGKSIARAAEVNSAWHQRVAAIDAELDLIRTEMLEP